MIQVFLSVLLVRIITVHILHTMNFYKLDRPLRYLLVIAHPDDESMFFGPFLTKILANKGSISIVVCTSGDKGGDKEVRSKEMERLCASHKVPLFMLEYPDSELAVTSKLLSSLEEIYRKTQSTALVTFDASGVSRHCDHITCCELGDALAKKVNTQHLYNLVSLTLIEKYIFPLLAVFRLGSSPDTDILITSSATESIKIERECGITQANFSGIGIYTLYFPAIWTLLFFEKDSQIKEINFVYFLAFQSAFIGQQCPLYELLLPLLGRQISGLLLDALLDAILDLPDLLLLHGFEGALLLL